MLHAYRMLMKSQHFVFILFALVIFFFVLWLDASYTIDLISHYSTQAPIIWVSYVFSLFIALEFFTVGLFIWCQVRSRRVALLFLLCCLAMMVFFTIKTHAMINLWTDVLCWMSDSGLIICISIFFVFFPREYLSSRDPGGAERVDLYPGFIRSELFMISYLWFISMGGAGIAALYLCVDMHIFSFAWILVISRTSYLTVTLPGLLFLFLWSYSQSKGARERSQLLLLGCGVTVTSAPFLVFSLLDYLSDYASLHGILVEGTLCLLPLIAGYALVRYQILLFDSTVRRWVSLFFCIAFFALLATCAFIGSRIFPSPWIMQQRNAVVIGIVFAVTLLTPMIWWLARNFTEKLFYREIALYHSLFDEPTRLSEDILEIDDVVHLITRTVVSTLQPAQVGVFVFDDSCGQYILHPNLASRRMDTDCLPSLMSVERGLNVTDSHQDKSSEYLDAHLPIIQYLELHHRPLILSSKVLVSIAPGEIKRYITSASFLDDNGWLFAPIRAQGKMIGLLILRACDERQPYTGIDIEIVHQLTGRYAMALETARLYARVSHQTSLLNSLYNVSIMPNSAFSTVMEAATTYVTVAAQSTSAAVEMWLYDRLKNELQLAVTAGHGPHLFSCNCLHDIQKRDWSACFFAQGQAIDEEMQATYLPSCLSQIPPCPFAWLPLHKDEQYMGILMITYAHPHMFLWEEMWVLEMFANQCLSTLENVQMTTELRTAYERQKDLDRLKDQFIMTASHELRTPLTTVLGYIELLDQYHEQLEEVSRAEFIEKARLGCDELSLLVSNIIDASHVNNYAETVHLCPISLMQTVSYVLEMMEATIMREHRPVTVNIDANVYVSADDARLRQVLLNLVSNALKYSAEGSSISISAHIIEQQAIIRIQDSGLGVPPDQQNQLFERFVRLERDINSPVRGAGLGLFICRRLLEAMEGRIWIESSGIVGQGSILAFALQFVPKKQSYRNSECPDPCLIPSLDP